LIENSDFGEFFLMQVFSVVFWMAMLGIWELEYDLLGMLEGTVNRLSQD
jgi:hypothetical protein